MTPPTPHRGLHGPLDDEPWPFRTCPTCDHRDFAAQPIDDRIVFTCMGCGSAWRWCLGHLVPVTAAAADGAAGRRPDPHPDTRATPPAVARVPPRIS